MSAVRTRNIFIGKVPANSAGMTLFLVPTDRTLIVKEFRDTNLGPSPGQLVYGVAPAGFAPGLIVAGGSTSAGQVRVAPSYMVLRPGDTLVATSGAVVVHDVVISGSLLLGVSA